METFVCSKRPGSMNDPIDLFQLPSQVHTPKLQLELRLLTNGWVPLSKSSSEIAQMAMGLSSSMVLVSTLFIFSSSFSPVHSHSPLLGVHPLGTLSLPALSFCDCAFVNLAIWACIISANFTRIFPFLPGKCKMFLAYLFVGLKSHLFLFFCW